MLMGFSYFNVQGSLKRCDINRIDSPLPFVKHERLVPVDLLCFSYSTACMIVTVLLIEVFFWRDHPLMIGLSISKGDERSCWRGELILLDEIFCECF